MKTLVVSLCCVVASACGELAVDGDYLGEPLFQIEGTVTFGGNASATDASGELRVALFWARPQTTSAGTIVSGALDSVTAVEQDVGAASSFPARYTLTVHEPPGAALIGTDAEVSGPFALAVLLVYLDEDGDGRWDRGVEQLVGAAAGALVLYAPDGLTGGRYGALGAGFHIVRAGEGSALCQATPTDAADLPIVVDMQFPATALADFDCDGSSVEWSGTCPSPATIFATCRGSATPTAMCTTCEPLLWDAGSDDAECQRWLDQCDVFTSTHECEEVLEHCFDEDCVEGASDCHEDDEH